MREWTTRPLTMPGWVAKAQPEVVERVQLKGQLGLDRRAAAAELLDQHRREHHDFALQIAKNCDAFRVALVVLRCLMGVEMRALFGVRGYRAGIWHRTQEGRT